MTYTLYDLDEVCRRFRKDTEEHQMSVLLNKGLYRHLQFRRQHSHTWMYWYEIVTTPGQLTIRGDMGTYVFSRVADMFEFFRGSHINPGYWGEKLIAISTMSGYREYSQDMARHLIREDFDNYKNGLVDPDKVWRSIEDEVLDEDVIVSKDLLRTELTSFRYPSDIRRPLLFEFVDVWDMDFTDYTFQYLWCCHAIRESIMQWDAHIDVRRQVLADATADANLATEDDSEVRT